MGLIKDLKMITGSKKREHSVRQGTERAQGTMVRKEDQNLGSWIKVVLSDDGIYVMVEMKGLWSWESEFKQNVKTPQLLSTFLLS